MKKLLVFLALSLAANAAFLVTFFVRPKAPAPAADAVVSTAAAPASPAATAAKLTAPDLAALERSRDLLDSRDLPLLVSRLRAAGFSTAQIRAIVGGELSRQMAARRLEIVRKMGPQPYWSNEKQMAFSRKLSAEFSAIGREQDATLKQLLGADAKDPALTESYDRGNLSFLPSDKVERLRAILSDYGELQAQLSTETHGMLLAEDREKLELLRREQQADIEKLLTPQELEDYNLRMAPASWNLRNRLGGFEATEDEYRALFRIFKDSRLGTSITTPNALSPGERQQAEADLRAQFEAALGPQRAADYRQMSDPNYAQVARLLDRLDLPTSLALQVTSVQQDIQQRASTIQRDRSLSAEDRRAQLAALAGEAESRLTTTLGERGLRAYKESSGFWLNTLVRQPQAAQPAMRLPGR